MLNLFPRIARAIGVALVLWMASVVVQASPEGVPQEAIPEGLELTRIDVWPAELVLNGRFDVGQVLLTGRLSSGEQIDVTRMATLVNNPDVVVVSKNRQIAPLTNGQQALQFELNGIKASLAVKVSGLEQDVDVSFVRDVAPALSKVGCNSGTCHGSKDGKRGFKLSLRGYDFLYDHRALTDDIAARRFNRANPDQSLMLLKATGSIPHVGGTLTRPGERHYELLRRWILAGAKLDLDAPRVRRIRLLPENPILPRAHLRQQMVVIAEYDDGSVRDVTSSAFIESGNIEVLSAESNGVITTLRRGESPVLARFEGAYTATTVTVMGDRTGFVWEQPPINNEIDRLVYDKLRRVKILPSELCTDAEFVRRVYLDLTGLPPRADEVRRFLDDRRDSRWKRDALVDDLIGSPEYIEHWTNKWSDMLQVNRKFLGEIGASALRDWIKDSVASNKPYDQMVYEVLTASGSNLDEPASAYWKVLRDPALAMENTTHLFLAVRFNCNKCHDHPFERWTQDQYYNLTAYFAQVGRKEDARFAGQKIGGSAVESATPLVEVIYDSGAGETQHERTGVTVQPSFPYTHEFSKLDDSTPRRKMLASWITSKNNRYFASSYVNRLWGYLLGVGIIEPLDDIRAGNPPTNPPLLEFLTRQFIDSGFDTRHVIRMICQSRVYQHSVSTNRWNQDDGINYSHAIPRRLPAEVLFDAIHLCSGTKSRIPGVPAGFRAAELPDAGVKLSFLDDFGRPPRESSCECERSSGIVLGPILKLINGPTVNNAITDPAGELTELAKNQPDDEALVDEIFVRFLGRSPTERELKFGVQALSASKGDDEQLRKKIDERKAELAGRQAEWEQSLRATPWSGLSFSSLRSDSDAILTARDDQSIFVSGPLSQDAYTLTLVTERPMGKITGLRVELLPDPSLPSGGPGRAENGNCVLSELTLDVQPAGAAGQPRRIALQEAKADFSQQNWEVAGAIDGNETTGWGIAPQSNRPHAATFETAEDIELTEGSRLTVRLSQRFEDGKHNLGRFRVSTTDAPRPFVDPNLPAEIKQIVAIPKEQRSAEQQNQLIQFHWSQDAELRNLEEALQIAAEQSQQHRLTGVQDLAWALINNPAFLFNR